MNGSTDCSIEGCAQPSSTRGWCKNHYQRWRRHGDPQGGGFPLGLAPDQGFRARVAQVGDCLIWQSSKSNDGYGFFYTDGHLVMAHRWAFEQEYGPIPEGMQVDHICHHEACVNHEHLRLATPSENSSYRRGSNYGSTTGVRNVYPNGNRFIVMIRKDGVLKSYGSFRSVDDARVVAEARRAELFGEFAGRRSSHPGRHPFEPEAAHSRPRNGRPTYRDKTANDAIGNVDSQRKKEKK